jgi:hypothetical protein
VIRDSRSSVRRRSLPVRLGPALVGALVALVALGVPLAWASHQFNDVPDSNPFHGDIAAVRGAGITSGKQCEGDPPGMTTFCPGENITREAMAAFVHRGFGRVAYDEQANVFPSPGPVDVAVVTISVGGVPGQTQFVKLDGQVGAVSTSPPDDVYYWISRDEGGQITLTNAFSLIEAGPFEITTYNSGAITAAVAVPSGTTQTFRLHAFDAEDSGGIEVWGQLTALTVPFGSTGSSTLGVDSGPPPTGGAPRRK